MNLKLIFCTLTALVWNIANAQIDKLWESQYQITSDTFETFGYETDGAGNFYLYGRQHNRAFIQKHDFNGTIQWAINDTILVDTAYLGYKSSDAKITDIIVDKNSDVIIFGIMSLKNFGNPHYENYPFATKLDNNGSIIWKKVYSFSNFLLGGSTAWETNLLADSDEDFFYIAYSPTAFQNSKCDGLRPFEMWTLALIKCDSDGNALWPKSYESNINACTWEYVSNIHIDNGSILLTAHVESQDKKNYGILNLELDTAGGERKRRFESNYFDSYTIKVNFTNKDLVAAFVVTDSTNQELRGIKVVGYDTATSPSFQTLTSSTFPTKFKSADFDDSVNTYVSGVILENASHRSFIQKISSTGSVSGGTIFEDSVVNNYVQLNSKRELLIFTNTSQSNSLGLHSGKMDKQGKLAWNVLIPGSLKFLYAYSDDSCNLYVIAQKEIPGLDSLFYFKFRDTTCLNDPINLSILGKGSDWISLGWETSDTQDYRTGFKISRSLDGLKFYVIDSVTREKRSFKDSILTSGLVHYYQVNAFNSFSNSYFSNVVYDTTLINGIPNHLTSQIKVYPNPVENFLFIESLDEIWAVDLFNCTGTCLISTKNKDVIDMRSFPPGIYFLQINKNLFFKILKL